jgi:methylenetetrahydrofolate dehydrogenase (NADP+)/methenyltetrahydrofolate cyclohydrolase
VELAGNAAQQEVEETIKSLNADSAVTGILLMMPLPPHLNGDVIGALIAPEKDVDCLNPLNAGELYPAAALGTLHSACLSCRAAPLRIELKEGTTSFWDAAMFVGKPVALLAAAGACDCYCLSLSHRRPALVFTPGRHHCSSGGHSGFCKAGYGEARRRCHRRRH